MTSVRNIFDEERSMLNDLSSIEDQTSNLIEATAKLLWAHRDDVINGKVDVGQARVYVALVTRACEALPASAADLECLRAACEAVNLAIAIAADREDGAKLGSYREPSLEPTELKDGVKQPALRVT